MFGPEVYELDVAFETTVNVVKAVTRYLYLSVLSSLQAANLKSSRVTYGCKIRFEELQIIFRIFIPTGSRVIPLHGGKKWMELQ